MPKNVPIRQCLGCRAQKPKSELLRVLRAPDGSVTLDTRGKAPGRGAYLCRDAACLRRAAKSRALERSLGVPLPEELLTQLEREMEARDG